MVRPKGNQRIGANVFGVDRRDGGRDEVIVGL